MGRSVPHEAGHRDAARDSALPYERMFYELTPDAIDLGLKAALPAAFEIGKEREFGRGERSGADTFQLVVHVDGRGAQQAAAARDSLTLWPVA
jgi:hypothetical protein